MILGALPPEKQADVARRIAQMDRTSPDVIKEVERVLERKLSSLVNQDYTIVGGIDSIVNILNNVDRATEKRIMESLEVDEPELAEEIRKKMFVFEDILLLDDRSIQRVLRDVENADLELALKSSTEEVQNVIFRNLSKRLAAMIKEDMDKPALIRNKAAKTATSIAEYFRDKGEDVLLMMDSLTRFSMAQREIGLASGEPPVTRGYPPSVYSEMPKLLERAGRADKGSITGLYTVLVDGDDFNEPITDTARSILDGHIMLDRKLGHKNHYPAIDVLQSISRVMSAIATKEHKNLAGRLKNVLATYTEAEDLINIGAYKNGSNPDIDYAIQKIGAVNSFLCQGTDEKFSFEEELELLEKVFE